MTDAGRVAGSAAWNVAGKLAQFAIALAAVAVIARWVGPHAYGVFALSWAIVGLVDILVSAAPQDALVQRPALRPGHGHATFWGSLGLALIAWVAIASFADPLAALLGGGAALAAILPLRCATLPLSAAACVPSALLMRAERFKAIAAADVAASLTSSAVGIASALLGAGIWSLVAMEIARQAVQVALLWRLSGWRPRFAMRREDATDLLGFNLRTCAAWGVAFIDIQVPRLLIGNLLGPQALGYYALAHRLYDQASDVLTVPAYQAVMAGIARLQGHRDAVARLVVQVLRATAVVASPVFLGLAAVTPILVPWVFGPEWAEAVTVAQLLMLLGIRSAASMVQMATIRAMGRPDWHLHASIVGLAVSVVLGLIAAPFGLLAIVASVIVRSYLVWPLYAVYVKRLTGIGLRQQGRLALGPFAAAATMFVATAALIATLGPATPAAIALAFAIGCGALCYAAALGVFARDALRFGVAALGPLLRRDRAALKSLFGTA